MRVSVVCPVFNTRPDELTAAVRSALDQDSGTVHEVLLADDATTSPDTLAAITALEQADSRVVVLRAVRNAGPADARNRAMDRATGTWIGFLDADDLWPQDKLSRAAALLMEKPSATWIIGDFANLRPDHLEPSKPAVPIFPADDTSGPTQCGGVLTRSIISDGLHLGACLIHKDVIGARRFDPAVLYGEDLLFLAKLSVGACADRAPGLGYICRRQHESMMYSPWRIEARFASGQRAGMRDKELKPYRREYRWALYDVYKDLAANNLLNGRRLKGLRFALAALSVDPREVKDLMKFLALMPRREASDLAKRARLYSRREQVLLSDFKSSRFS